MKVEDEEAELRIRVGLCAGCGHARRIESARGSVFLQCGLSKSDARYRAYPPLPVHECTGFSAREQH